MIKICKNFNCQVLPSIKITEIIFSYSNINQNISDSGGKKKKQTHYISTYVG